MGRNKNKGRNTGKRKNKGNKQKPKPTTNHYKGNTDNMTTIGQSQQRTVSGTLACDFYLDTDVKARFDEYARAAKTEIGGLIRVQKNEDGDYVATDLKIFPQKATGATFDLDEGEVTKFMMELHREGRDEEMMEWQNIIHSHPNNTRPFLSGVDRPNLINCAGSERWAWSVIMTRKDTISTDGTEYKVHFYQAPGANNQGLGILIQDLPVLLVDKRRKEIEAEVEELIAKPVYQSYSAGGWKGGRGGSGNSFGFQSDAWSDDDVLGYALGAGAAPQQPQQQASLTNAEEAAIAADVAHAVEEEFKSMGITVGAVVTFTPTEYSMVGEDAENVTILTEMADQQFTVEEFDAMGRAVFNGFGFDPDEVELVQTAEGHTVEECFAEASEVEVPAEDDELAEA